MQETRTLCDVEECKNLANRFSFFKERRMDGAGGSENWYYTFDLCTTHQSTFVTNVIDHVSQASKDLLLKELEELKVRFREE